jgi:hypothetical protein
MQALLIFLDETGFCECPSVRRTWGPRGKTPVLVVPFNWKRLSAIAMERLCWLSSGSRGGLPWFAVADDGVEYGQQFAHTGNQGQFFGFTSGQEFFVMTADFGVTSYCGQGGHVQAAAQFGAAGPDGSSAAELAAVVVHWGHAHQGGDPLPGAESQFHKAEQKHQGTLPPNC